MRGVEQLAKEAAAAVRAEAEAEAAREREREAAWVGMVRDDDGVVAPPRRKYRGVKTLKSGRFAAEIWDPVAQRRARLGTFSSAEVAACAYDRAAREMQGSRAKPNFPDGPPSAAVAAAVSAAFRKGAGAARWRAPAGPAPPAAPAPAPAPEMAPEALPLQRARPPADQFSFKPASDSPPVPAYPFLHAHAPARARIVLQPAPAPATAPETERAPPVITFVRSVPPKPFSFARAGAPHTFQPVDFPVPPIHIVSNEQMLARPADSCFSSTMEPAGASWSRRIAPSHRPVPKKPKLLGVPTPSVSTEAVTDDNFTDVTSPWSRAAWMPFSLGAL